MKSSIEVREPFEVYPVLKRCKYTYLGNEECIVAMFFGPRKGLVLYATKGIENRMGECCHFWAEEEFEKLKPGERVWLENHNA